MLIPSTRRQASLIHYFQTIERLPAVHPQLQDAKRQIFKLFTVIEMLEPSRCPAVLFVPGFLAATVCTTEEDRTHLLEVMKGYDNVKGVVEDRDFIKKLWAESDKAGIQVDWHEMASETAGPAFL